PAGLAPVLRRTLHQAELAQYAVQRVGGRYRASNPAQRLQVVFTAAGPRLATMAAPHWTWRLTLVGYGRSRLQGAAAGCPVARGAWLVYRRGALVEWYRNSPQGLEQGFTLAARPVGPRGQPLTLVLRMTGSLRAQLERGGQAVALLTPGGAALWRYSGL